MTEGLVIDESLLSLLDMRYKRADECDRDMRAADAARSDLDKRLAVIEHAQKVNNWLTGAIAAGIIALVIKVFIGG